MQICFVFGLFTGTFSALVCKMAYDTKSIGLDGSPKAFAKPIMMLLLMFTGMYGLILMDEYIHFNHECFDTASL